MTQTPTIITFAALAAALSGCQGVPSTARTLSEADIKSINQTRDAFVNAQNAGDSSTVAALYTEKGVCMPPNNPLIEGREAIQAWETSLEGFGPPQLSMTSYEIDGLGSIAYDRGAYSHNSSKHRVIGKYLLILRKVHDTWLIDTAIGNRDNDLDDRVATSVIKR